MIIGCGIGLWQAALGGGGGPADALKSALLAYGPTFLLIADKGAVDLSGNGRDPIASPGGYGAPTLESGAMNGKAAFIFDGTQGYGIPAHAFKHVFVVMEKVGRDWVPANTSVYLSAASSAAAEYRLQGDGSGTLWTDAGFGGNTWMQNGLYQQGGGGTPALSFPDLSFDCVNVYQNKNATATQASTTHTLGAMAGVPARCLDGRIYAVVTFSEVLSEGDALAVSALLEDYYRHRLILCHGDSLTFGENSIPAQSYPRQLRELLGRQNWNLWPVGISGITIGQLTSSAPDAVDYSKPEVLVFWGGTNNVGFAAGTAAQAFNDLVAYCTARRVALPSTRIYVCTLRPSTSAPSSNPSNYNVEAPLFNASVVGDARFVNGVLAHGVVRIDQIPQLVDPDDATYTSDGLHLTAAGYALVAAAVQPFI